MTANQKTIAPVFPAARTQPQITGLEKRRYGGVDLGRQLPSPAMPIFYALAHQMGIDKLHRFWNRFGLVVLQEWILPENVADCLPSREWKNRHGNNPGIPAKP